MDEDHPCRQCLDVRGLVAFGPAEAAWSHSPATSLPRGSSCLSAKPASASAVPSQPRVPTRCRGCAGEPRPFSSQAGQAGDTRSGGFTPQQAAQALGDACARSARRKTAGEAARSDPGLFCVPCDQHGGVLAHGGSRGAVLYRHFAAQMRTQYETWFSSVCKIQT